MYISTSTSTSASKHTFTSASDNSNSTATYSTAAPLSFPPSMPSSAGSAPCAQSPY